MARITAEYDYVQGHLRYGHQELILEGEKLEKFKLMSVEDQEYSLKEDGEFILDDYSLEDKGSLGVVIIIE